MPRIRAEENAVLLWNRETGGTALISGAELDALERWAVSGQDGGFIRRLSKLRILDCKMQKEIARTIAACREKRAPHQSFCAPESLHIELTTRCPLSCRQCYKAGAEIRDLPLSTLEDLLLQAEHAGVFQIALGGGEPLSYPHLEAAVNRIKAGGMSCSVTTSGVGLTKARLDSLLAAGVNHIQVSLNGSTAKVNQCSRDGFPEAMEALTLLSQNRISFGINWVARKDNLPDLSNLLALAEQINVGNVNILRYKPSECEDYEGHSLSQEEQLLLAAIIRSSKRVAIKVDSAYSSLLCHLNGRAGYLSGCGAGRRFLAVDAGGHFRPCSHVDLAEPMGDLMQYWYHSQHLAVFRQAEDTIGEPCSVCEYLSGCRGCRAIAGGCSGDFGCAYYRSGRTE